MGIFSWSTKNKEGYKIKASRLSGLAMDEYMKEAEKIVQEFGGVIANVMPKVKTRYRAMVFPSSLLPASKSDIKEAFDMFLEPDSLDLPEEQRSSMSMSYMFLDKFIDDEDAKTQNEERIFALEEDVTETKDISLREQLKRDFDKDLDISGGRGQNKNDAIILNMTCRDYIGTEYYIIELIYSAIGKSYEVVEQVQFSHDGRALDQIKISVEGDDNHYYNFYFDITEHIRGD